MIQQISGEYTVNIAWFSSDYQISGEYQADIDIVSNNIWELVIKSLTVLSIDGNVIYENLDLYRNDLSVIDGFWFDFAAHHVMRFNGKQMVQKAKDSYYGT
jgi:hypothetical protein